MNHRQINKVPKTSLRFPLAHRLSEKCANKFALTFASLGGISRFLSGNVSCVRRRARDLYPNFLRAINQPEFCIILAKRIRSLPDVAGISFAHRVINNYDVSHNVSRAEPFLKILLREPLQKDENPMARLTGLREIMIYKVI